MADKPKNPESPPGDSDTEALRAFAGGYLHQDFLAEYNTPADALHAYCREASRREILELESGLARFMEKTKDMAFADAKELFVRELHSGWSPPNRDALAHLLQMVRDELGKK